MKNVSCLILALAICFLGNSQKGAGFTGYQRKKVENLSERYITSNKYQNCTITKTDSVLLMEIRDVSVQNADYFYHFNQSGICDEDTKLTRCSSCLLKFLEFALSDPKYKWIKLNANLYVSKYSKYRMVEIVDKDEACPFVKTSLTKWTKMEYQKLIADHANQ